MLGGARAHRVRFGLGKHFLHPGRIANRDFLGDLRLGFGRGLDLGFRLLRKRRFFDDGFRIRRHVIVIEQRPLAGRDGVRMRRLVDFGLGLRFCCWRRFRLRFHRSTTAS